ncbi:hypothetical protein QQ045_010304 [Rhodiola kirilowii]
MEDGSASSKKESSHQGRSAAATSNGGAAVEGIVKGIKIEIGGASTKRQVRQQKEVAGASREGLPHEFFAQVQGADKVVIPVEKWECATAKFRNALVGFVFDSKPYLGRMKGFVRAKWGDESMVRVSQLNEGIFLINFNEEAKKMKALLGGP